MAAVYLCTEKHRGWALNKVGMYVRAHVCVRHMFSANFHIRNGACVWRVNFNADTSARAWTSSYSMMAHYRYSLERLQKVPGGGEVERTFSLLSEHRSVCA
jgi:malonyl-CoA decarboxylase